MINKGEHNRLNLVNQRFGRLVVIGYSYTKNKHAYWDCLCDCGTEKKIQGSSLKSGYSLSCGCIRIEQIITRNYLHGLRGSKFYKTWNDMIGRCFNPTVKEYPNYGGRGISVVPEWRFNPKCFIEWCEEKNPAAGYSIDRIDNNGDYSPNNCRFVLPKDQNRNMRSNVWVEYNNEKLIFKDFVEKYGVVSYECAKGRVLHRGWDRIIAALTPKMRNQ